MIWQDKHDQVLLENLSAGLSKNESAEVLSATFKIPFTYQQVRHRLISLDKITKQIEPAYRSNSEILGDGSHKSDKLLKMSENESKDVNYLLKAHGYNNKCWELVSARSNIWNTNNKETGIETLYSSKIIVKPLTNITPEKAVEIFNKLDRTYKFKEIKHTPKKSNKMLELNIADLHLGKLSWNGDSNDTYDMKIAEERFFYIIADVMYKTKHIDFDYILFIWSNDFFHFDNIAQTTTAGTQQDTDTRWAKMYNKGVEMLTQAIENLTRIAKVETIYIGSNHDKQTSYYAIKHIEAWFRKDENVKADARPISRKYHEYGNNLIQFTHGHNEGKRIGCTMEVEARQAWGRTVHHEVHAGHFHTDQVKTMPNGTVIRYSPSPSGTDVWHFEKGYTGSTKKGQSYVWDYDSGIDMIIPTTILK